MMIIELNYNEFILIWGIYGMSILLALSVGHLIGYLRALRKKEVQDR